MLNDLVPHHARRFGRAIVMPNLNPAVTTTDLALAYKQRIVAAIPEGLIFNPLMTLYLTEATPISEIEKAKESGEIFAVKLYPAGATTNSSAGVTSIEKVIPILKKMAELSMPLLIHAEVTQHDVDVFDREIVFMEKVLRPLIDKVSNLHIVVEHVTTAEMADFVISAGDRVAATLTPQHLRYNRNALLVGGIHPHHFCLPVLKRERHRLRLREIVASGHPRFFLGTDSAPHIQSAKESGCGCAGIFSGHCAIEIYAEIFEELNALEHFEAFASLNGPRFYGLEPNQEEISLVKSPWMVPDTLPLGNSKVVPFEAGNTLMWKLGERT